MAGSDEGRHYRLGTPRREPQLFHCRGTPTSTGTGSFRGSVPSRECHIFAAAAPMLDEGELQIPQCVGSTLTTPVTLRTYQRRACGQVESTGQGPRRSARHTPVRLDFDNVKTEASTNGLEETSPTRAMGSASRGWALLSNPPLPQSRPKRPSPTLVRQPKAPRRPPPWRPRLPSRKHHTSVTSILVRPDSARCAYATPACLDTGRNFRPTQKWTPC